MATTHRTAALLLGRVEHGDSNLILALFTQRLGKISALAKGARNSRRRFGGALEPMHTLAIEIEEGQGELSILREASIVTARSTLISRLLPMQAAGQALRWVKHATAARTPEPVVWNLLQDLLDALDRRENAQNSSVLLAEYGVRLLAAFGWGLELERCVRCGRVCPPDKKAFVSPTRGGLLCRQCGGARFALSPPLRRRLLAVVAGSQRALHDSDYDTVLQLLERSWAEHASLDEKREQRS